MMNKKEGTKMKCEMCGNDFDELQTIVGEKKETGEKNETKVCSGCLDKIINTVNELGDYSLSLDYASTTFKAIPNDNDRKKNQITVRMEIPVIVIPMKIWEDESDGVEEPPELHPAMMTNPANSEVKPVVDIDDHEKQFFSDGTPDKENDDATKKE